MIRIRWWFYGAMPLPGTYRLSFDCLVAMEQGVRVSAWPGDRVVA